MVRELARKSDLLKKFNFRQLQELCDVFGIKKGGSKEDLVKRLERSGF